MADHTYAYVELLVPPDGEIWGLRRSFIVCGPAADIERIARDRLKPRNGEQLSTEGDASGLPPAGGMQPGDVREPLPPTLIRPGTTL